MAHSYGSLLYHLIWATWNREPLLSGQIEQHVYSWMREQCAERGWTLEAIGGIEDHLHLLLQVPASEPLAIAVKQLKGASAHSVNASHGRPAWSFRWQGGYGAFTVSPRDLSLIKGYIERQKEHHASNHLWLFCEPPDGPSGVREGGLHALPSPGLQSGDDCTPLESAHLETAHKDGL